MQHKNAEAQFDGVNIAVLLTSVFHDWQKKVYILLTAFLLMLLFGANVSAAVDGFVARSEEGCYHQYCYEELLDSYAKKITGQPADLYEDYISKSPVAIYTTSGSYLDYGALLDHYAVTLKNGGSFHLEDYLQNGEVDSAGMPDRINLVSVISGLIYREEKVLAEKQEAANNDSKDDKSGSKSGSETDQEFKTDSAEDGDALVTYITGSAKVSKEEALEWAKGKNAHRRFIDVAPFYWEYGEKSEIRPEVLFAQAAHETGFGHYKGIVPPEYNNWAGIKTASASGNEPEDHEKFETPEDGVRGHFNHMSAYVGLSPIGETHGRYDVVTRLSWTGTVETIEDLSGKWAPSPTYHVRIINMLKEMDQ